MVPYLHIETRIPGRAHDSLKRDMGFATHPSFAVIDAKGGLWTRASSVLAMAQIEGLLAEANKRRGAFLKLKEAAGAGDAKAKDKFAVWELELKHVTYEDFRKRYPDISKLDEDLRDTVLGIQGDIIFKQGAKALQAAQKDGGKVKLDAAFLTVGETFLSAAKQGAEPADENPRKMFYFYMGHAGLLHARIDMLEIAAVALEEDAEDDERLTQRLKIWKMAIDKLKKDAAEPTDGK